VSSASNVVKAALLSTLFLACTTNVGSIGENGNYGADAGFADEPESESESDPEPSPTPEPGSEPDPEPEPPSHPEEEPEPPTNTANQACYLGNSGTNTTCLPVVEINAYTYPAGSGNYSRPTGFLDIDAVDLNTKVSPNFRLGEIAVRVKGKYQVVQPHAISKLQHLRDSAGHALTINSGFRSPDYNSSVGGATMSRHMYGDAFDIMPGATGRDALMQKCRDLGAGYVAKYANTGHIHCDWRSSTLDSEFFGFVSNLLFGENYWSIYDVEAEMVLDEGVYSVLASGYDETEGELARDWIAFDEDGNILAEAEAMTFVPPVGTHTVFVDVGGLIEVESRVDVQTSVDGNDEFGQ
tara:strand:- start:7102 stop:8160 length:1059 start_codon:yes stop_codon:yes gene_type:complete